MAAVAGMQQWSQGVALWHTLTKTCLSTNLFKLYLVDALFACVLANARRVQPTTAKYFTVPPQDCLSIRCVVCLNRAYCPQD